MLDGLLPAMRDAVLRTLPTDVDVRVRTRTRTPSGGSAYTWATAASTKCRVDAQTQEDMEIADRLKIKSEFAVILPSDVAVTPDNQLRIGGVDYDVFAVFANETEPVLKKALVARAGAA